MPGLEVAEMKTIYCISFHTVGSLEPCCRRFSSANGALAFAVTLEDVPEVDLSDVCLFEEYLDWEEDFRLPFGRKDAGPTMTPLKIENGWVSQGDKVVFPWDMTQPDAVQQ